MSDEMRDIKFRAFIKGSSEIVHVSIIDFDRKIIELGRKHAFSEFCFGEVELMQYTGLKDREGNEIYEGDIFKDNESKNLHEVIWERNGFKGLYRYISQYQGERYKDKTVTDLGTNTADRRWGVDVVENVFENPELLKLEI